MADWSFVPALQSGHPRLSAPKPLDPRLRTRQFALFMRVGILRGPMRLQVRPRKARLRQYNPFRRRVERGKMKLISCRNLSDSSPGSNTQVVQLQKHQPCDTGQESSPCGFSPSGTRYVFCCSPSLPLHVATAAATTSPWTYTLALLPRRASTVLTAGLHPSMLSKTLAGAMAQTMTILSPVSRAV